MRRFHAVSTHCAALLWIALMRRDIRQCAQGEKDFIKAEECLYRESLPHDTALTVIQNAAYKRELRNICSNTLFHKRNQDLLPDLGWVNNILTLQCGSL